MKTCLICPVPSLEQYVDEQCTYHLLLAHLLEVPGYVDFYRQRAKLGDYVILDNGAKELGAGFGMEKLLKGATQVGAKEVVLSDVRFNASQTVRAAQSGLNWMMTLKGRLAYENAGCPKLMVVPQGTNLTQWFDCLRALLVLVGDFIATVEEMPEPTVAYAYHYDHLFKGGLPKLLDFGRPAEDIHFLGWTRNLSTLQYLADECPEVRSVDSGRPFSYAKAGLHCAPGVDNPGRDKDFFTEAMPEDKDELTRSNINTFRQMAQDV